MLRFYAVRFFTLADLLRQADTFMRQSNKTGKISNERAQSWKKMIATLLKLSDEIGLRTLSSHLKIQDAVSDSMEEEELRRAITSTHDILTAELSNQHMFIIPHPENTDLFDNPQPFGQEVFNAFPSARFDIVEASKCLSLDRSTATVLHLMRGLEGSLNVLSKVLKISFSHNNWETILNQIPKKIEEIEKRKRKPKNWRELRQFYAEAGAHLDLIKDAFRNWSMHLHKTYDIVTAKELFHHTKAFMRHLATRLKE